MNEGFVVSSLVSSAMSFFFFLYLHAQKLRPTHSLVLFFAVRLHEWRAVFGIFRRVQIPIWS